MTHSIIHRSILLFIIYVFLSREFVSSDESLLLSTGEGALEFIKRCIDSNEVVVFSKSYCPYSSTVKRNLYQINGMKNDEHQLNIMTVEVNLMSTGDEKMIEAELEEETGEKFLPLVYVNGEFVGGFEEILALGRNGKLLEMLHEEEKTLSSGELPLDFITQTVEEHKIVIFSKSNCPLCKEAKKILHKVNGQTDDNTYIEIMTIELDLMDGDDGELINQVISENTGFETVPHIFLGGKYLGTFEHLEGLTTDEIIDFIEGKDKVVAEDEDKNYETTNHEQKSFLSSGEDVNDFVLNLIKSGKVVIFSKSYCPYCKEAKHLLRKINNKYDYDSQIDIVTTELDFMKEMDGLLVKETLISFTNQRTVPYIFLNGKFIGGNSDLHEMHENGVLEEFFEEIIKLGS